MVDVSVWDKCVDERSEIGEIWLNVDDIWSVDLF